VPVLARAHPAVPLLARARTQPCLFWRARSVLVLKKLGDEQRGAFLRVLRYLGGEERMRCVVEPHEYLKLGEEAADLANVDTYNKEEAGRRAAAACPAQKTLWAALGFRVTAAGLLRRA
jgi:hypothetical protein